MSIRILGAIFIIISCGGFGFIIAANHKKEVKTLRQLIKVLEFMECELQYRLTPLPELCRRCAESTSGIIRQVFMSLESELAGQISPDAQQCLLTVLQMNRDIPKSTRDVLLLMGSTFGQFDIDGQVKSLESVRLDAQERLEKLSENQDMRLRSYQTLGLCAGAAIAILFI